MVQWLVYSCSMLRNPRINMDRFGVWSRPSHVLSHAHVLDARGWGGDNALQIESMPRDGG